MWKPIKGYEGYYEVSDDGHVRSLDRHVKNFGNYIRQLTGKEMKLTLGRNGYYVVNLRKERTTKVYTVHTLVAQAYLENPYNYPTVNHKDGNKLNNTVDNLEWVSYGENNIHALKNNLRKPRGVSITQYDYSFNKIATFRSVTDASRKTGISRESISLCVNHYTHSAGGYIWVKNSEGQTTIPDGSTPEIGAGGSASRPNRDEDIVYTIRNDGEM